MGKKHHKYTKEEIIKIAQKHSTRGDFQKYDRKFYIQSKRMGIFELCCQHMDNTYDKRLIPEKTLSTIAKKYTHRSDFCNQDHAAYEAARRRGILNKICKHMIPTKPRIKKAERELLSFIKSHFSDAQNKWFYNLEIKRRPYIHSFELDVFIPSLNKAIELDGTFWHSKKQMTRKKTKWPTSARKDYHKIKDKVFLENFNIEILHITDIEWNKDRVTTQQKIINFLTS